MSVASTSAYFVSAPSQSATSSTDSVATRPSATLLPSNPVLTGLSLSFEDPRLQPDTQFELHVRSDLPKLVKRCRGNCGRDITKEHQLVVKSNGVQRWMANGKEMSRNGPLFIHFEEDCLKNYDTKNYYAPFEPFKWDQVTINNSTRNKLTVEELAFLNSLGIH